MIYKTLLATVLCAATAASLNADLTRDEIIALFQEFKKTHNRQYASKGEEFLRFTNFHEHLRLIDERNAMEKAAGGSAVHGITRFADLSQEEFQKYYLDMSVAGKMQKRNSKSTRVHVPLYNGTSTAVDYAATQITAIKDQGSCGSCWAHAAAEQIESDGMRLLGNPASLTLSVQQLVSCDHGKDQLGCGGGLQETAFDYVRENGGIVTEAAYPYTSGSGDSGTCQTSNNKYVMGVTGYDFIIESDPLVTETSFASYMLSQGGGTVSIGVDANMWSTYKSGVMSKCGAGKVINHSVQIVGVDTSAQGYWKIRNSWSDEWGEGGHIRVSYGANTCGLATEGGSHVNVFNI